ncbi:MAG: hypothetical protein ACP5MD_01415 [Verrucomicrobiia bacterium]
MPDRSVSFKGYNAVLPEKAHPIVVSATLPGRINQATDRTRVSITQIRRPNIDRLGAGKNARAPAARWKRATGTGARTTVRGISVQQQVCRRLTSLATLLPAYAAERDGYR